MSTTTILLLVFLVGVVVVLLSGIAGRLDRLHHRVDVSAETLNTQLARRCSSARAVAASGALDPVSSMLISEAAEGSAANADADKVTRGLVESELSRALRAAFDDPDMAEIVRAAPGGEGLLSDLETSCARVELSRRFHNDAVSACRLMRQRRSVRYLRLAGSAPEPASFEMDDTPPRFG